MKKVYLVCQVDDKGRITGSIYAFSTYKKAIEECDYLNDLLKKSEFIIETHNVN